MSSNYMEYTYTYTTHTYKYIPNKHQNTPHSAHKNTSYLAHVEARLCKKPKIIFTKITLLSTAVFYSMQNG